MGTAYSWHPRIALVNPRWPRAQSLLADELLSSWLIRNAFAHGCSPMSLTGNIWPGWRCWTIDLDRGMAESKLLPLSKMTGIGVSDICSSTLRPIAKVLTPALDHHKGTWPWILALGTRNRRHVGGLQCCPLCSAEGVPYYRLSSRLAWHTCCERHQVRLIDSCPECGAPLQPHLLEQMDLDCGHCHRCRTPFSTHSDGLGFAAGALAFQRAADDAMRGLTSEDDPNCDPGEWFYRARFIIGILKVAAVNGSKPFAAFRDTFHLGAVARPDSGLPIELLCVADRMDLLSAAWKVMDMGKHQLSDAIIACSLPRHSLRIPAGEIPVPLQATLDALPSGKARKRASIVFRSPASQHTVAKLWARLKRKVQRDG
ncbi:TniQ family protein [Pseudomonas brassicacearum]|uniref:TniQ family protein n=1 Tax=Pseudomonas brassicacearum TaxID=930166 RepID=UPI000720C911|nr:TniQ family protein [Pseudomonas brassicacearum]ALQ06504.1 hypothetical protein AK973_6055 [Pseudomonas brassicacearum]